VAGATSGAGAQRVVTAPSVLEASAGSSLEEYLRARQLDSAVAFHPVGVRAYSPTELRRMLAGGTRHPWSGRTALDSARGPTMYALRPTVGTVYNSSFPLGGNDGAVWAGRGLTGYVSAGVHLLAGPLSVRLEPIAFRAQNDAFRLFDETRPAEIRLRDPIEPGAIDQPQRFGTGAYQRVDLGNSEVRLTVGGATLGASSALEAWGPAQEHPLVLGVNAPGFVHGFFGTARPLPIGIGRLHGRVVVGRLEQSALSPAPDSLAVRLMSGAVVTFVPRWLPNVELGATRFFHRRWRSDDVASAWRIPFEGLLFKEGRLDLDDTSSTSFLPDNQLASAFARWRLPRAGAEVYGEYARNDASFNVRELIGEPDHASAYVLGARKALTRRADRLLVAGGEVLNARVTHINRVRPQARLYQHTPFTQGHTHRGQVLGSTAALGGSGVVLRVDDYTPAGRTSLALDRTVRLTPLGEGAPSAEAIDVLHSIRAARTRFRGPLDLTLGATLTYEQRRDFRADALNVRVDAAARVGW
jgi:hypothetical protein